MSQRAGREHLAAELMKGVLDAWGELLTPLGNLAGVGGIDGLGHAGSFCVVFGPRPLGATRAFL
jgi:hypothetical protein